MKGAASSAPTSYNFGRWNFMATYDWKPFLEKWSKEFIASRQFADFLLDAAKLYSPNYIQEIIESGWLGYPGAVEDQIRQVETRLGTILPPSYCDFLRVSNSWPAISRFTPKIWSTEEIEWLFNKDPDFIKLWQPQPEPYRNPNWDFIHVWTDDPERYYNPDWKSEDISDEWNESQYIASTLQISDDEEFLRNKYLLNPMVVNPQREWEAWVMSVWGAVRYTSFWELMQAEYKNFLELKDLELE